MFLFETVKECAQDVFRNIRAIKVSQDLFDDLSVDPLNWNAAITLESLTHPLVSSLPLIQRAFDYSKNEFIDYPFVNITRSRYSDGSIPCWYGSQTLETTLYETRYHFLQEIRDSWVDVFQYQKIISIDRRAAKIYCQGLGLDLTNKKDEFPWLVDSLNYTHCQQVGRRVAGEGHPLLIVPSARHKSGCNFVVFNRNVLSNPREYCRLHYVFNVSETSLKIFRRDKEIQLEPITIDV